MNKSGGAGKPGKETPAFNEIHKDPGKLKTSRQKFDNLEEQLHDLQIQVGQYQSTLSAAQDGFLRMNGRGKVLETNEAFCRMSGFSAGELIQMYLSDIKAGESWRTTAQALGNVKVRGFERFETRLARKDGSLYDVEVSLSWWPVKREFLAFIRDITGRKETEQRQAADQVHQEELNEKLYSSLEELQSTEEELRTSNDQLIQQSEEMEQIQVQLAGSRQHYHDLFEMAPDGNLVTDLEGKIEESNQAALKLLNAKAQTLLGKKVVLLITKEEREKFRSHFENFRNSGESGSLRWETYIRPLGMGESIPIVLTLSAYRSSDGKLAGLRWVLRDITARRKNELELADYHRRLEQEVQARTAEIESANIELQKSRLAALNLLEDSRQSQVKLEEANRRLEESENQYRTLFNGMTEGFALHEIICDADGQPVDYRFLDINPAFERLTGLKRSEVIGRTHNEVLPNDSADWVEIYGKVALSGEPVNFDNYSPALGKYYEVYSFSPVERQLAVIFMDITQRKLAELSLQNERANLQMIFDAVNVGMLLIGEDGSTRRANNIISQWSGREPIDIRGMQPGEVLGCVHAVTGQAGCGNTPFCVACQLRNTFETVLSTGKPVHGVEIESTLLQNGVQNHVWLDVSADPVLIDGKPVAVLALNNITAIKTAEQAILEARDELESRVRDRTQELLNSNQLLNNEITERIHIEAALRESETRYRTLFETSPDAIFLVDLESKVIFANHQAAVLHGYRQAKKMVGLDVTTLAIPEYQEHVRASLATALESGPLREFQYLIRSKDSSRRPAEMNISVVRDEHEQPIGCLLDIRDITERRQAEDSLRLANAYNRSLIEASLDPLVTITPEGKIGDVNSATEKVTGYTRKELIGTDFSNYFSEPEKARAGYQKVFESGTVHDYALEIRHRDGSTTPVLYNASIYTDEGGKVLGVFAGARDITDRKQFETQLVQAEKHAVIGRMVGSITHEINNPLQTIKNCLYLIQEDVPEESPAREPLEMASSETLRLTNLVAQLRELYRPKAGQSMQLQELMDIIEEAHALLVPHLNSAHVEWVPLTGLQRCYINCVRDQILEVFLNISVNAVEAMQSHGGKLFVDMKVTEQWVSVVFKDNGPGIQEKVLTHLFEPFTTSKSSGLGLGLSITYGIIQRHGGQITVENQPGQGAAFTVMLPLKGQEGTGQEVVIDGNE